MSNAKAPSTTAAINRLLLEALEPRDPQVVLDLALLEALDLTGSTGG